MAPLVLVRYGELALKSPPVRREFEATLRRNILALFASEGLECRLRSDRGHFYVEVADADRAIALLRRVFGVTSVSQVWPVASDPAQIKQAVIRLAEPTLAPGCSFAVRARRTGNHPFTSQQLAGEVGHEVLTWYADRKLSVDLEHPDVELFVEVRDKVTYLSLGRMRGPGGLPSGVAGHVVALVDGRRGALGAYLMMKRGCRTALVTTPEGEELARLVLARFDPGVSITSAPTPGPPRESTLLRVVENERAEAIVLPLSVEEYPAARGQWKDRMVFSPTVGLADAEVEDRWRGVVALAG